MDSCLVTVGKFCPVETIGAILFAVALFAFAGFPIRWAIRRHLENALETNPEYEPSGFLLFMHRHAGNITLLCVGCALAVLFLI